MACQFIAVGCSLGGFDALKTVLGGLAEDFPSPIAVVQHRSSEDSNVFASLLANHTQLRVIEVDDKQAIEDGHVYVCPPNYHMLIDGDHFALSTEAPVLHARPSIDVFFESAAQAFRDGVVAVLLTGMSRDGTAGLKTIRKYGGYAVVQDPAAAEGYVMPQAAIASGAVDKVLALEEIGPFITGLCAGQRDNSGTVA